MRDPERIDVVLDALRVFWKSMPDQRFAQLMYNVLVGGDVNYNMEDEEFVKELEAFKEKHK